MEKLIKETIDTKINDIRNLFIVEKEKEAIKDRILRDIRNPFRLEKENNAIKVKYFELLVIILRIKKKKIIINQ